MRRSELEYYLDRLHQNDFAHEGGGDYSTGEVFWRLTPNGRAYVMTKRPA